MWDWGRGLWLAGHPSAGSSLQQGRSGPACLFLRKSWKEGRKGCQQSLYFDGYLRVARASCPILWGEHGSSLGIKRRAGRAGRGPSGGECVVLRCLGRIRDEWQEWSLVPLSPIPVPALCQRVVQWLAFLSTRKGGEREPSCVLGLFQPQAQCPLVSLQEMHLHGLSLGTPAPAFRFGSF